MTQSHRVICELWAILHPAFQVVIKDEPFEMNAPQTLLYKQLHVLAISALVFVFIDVFSISPTPSYKRYEGICWENKLKLIQYSN